MKISYAILTHNEGEYIQNLIPFLLKNKQPKDEVVVVDDFSDDPLTKEILNKYKDQIILEYREFDGDHTQKNYFFLFRYLFCNFPGFRNGKLETIPDLSVSGSTPHSVSYPDPGGSVFKSPPGSGSVFDICTDPDLYSIHVRIRIRI
jgi:glycosyltransferase involved in cell wall biosynthesis